MLAGGEERAAGDVLLVLLLVGAGQQPEGQAAPGGGEQTLRFVGKAGERSIGPLLLLRVRSSWRRARSRAAWVLGRAPTNSGISSIDFERSIVLKVSLKLTERYGYQ